METSFWSLPMTSGGRDIPVGVDEMGNTVFETVGGARYAVQTQAPQRQSVVRNALGALRDDPVGTIGNALSGAAQGAWDTFSAPGRAASGESVTMGDVADVAGMVSLPALAGKYDPNRANMGGLSELIERVDLNTPANLKDKKYTDPSWHQASKTKLPSAVETATRDKGTLSPDAVVRIDDLQGATLVPAFGDRTGAGYYIDGINGNALAAPVNMQGGRNFMRETGTGIWASERAPMAAKSRVLDSVDDPVLAYTAMGGESGDFSHMMADSVMGQIPNAKITKKAAREYDKIIKDTVDPNWPGILSDGATAYVNKMSGSNRRLLWQAMEGKQWTDKGFPHIGQTRLAITDEDLLGANPFDTGLNFGRPHGGLLEDPAVPHSTYNTQIGGDYVGRLDESVPGSIVWRDFFDERRSSGARPMSDQRAFMMQPGIKQTVDQQMVDEINLWLEGR